MSQVSRLLLGLVGANIGLTGYLIYDNQARHAFIHEEMEARMDEVEGTMRGHIGLMEDSLQRIEDRQLGKKDVKGAWGQGMSERAEKNYAQRGKDDREKGSKS